jgi:hypothetical protein
LQICVLRIVGYYSVQNLNNTFFYKPKILFMFTSERMRKSLRSAMLVLCSLLLAVGTISAQNITVKGTVIDGAGEPVVGAYVLVEGTQVGTMADENGSIPFLLLQMDVWYSPSWVTETKSSQSTAVPLLM